MALALCVCVCPALLESGSLCVCPALLESGVTALSLGLERASLVALALCVVPSLSRSRGHRSVSRTRAVLFVERECS